ncbi:MAG: FkbM family methyltransferase [Candidatus Bathyarchaeota archaeon]|nr:FkbM family methyltransferase [Candidatus Bathyarchaeota archaeon]
MGLFFEVDGFFFEAHIGRAFDGDKADWDKGIVESIFQHRYDPPGFDIPNGLVLDIGAHIGSFSVYASQKASKVYAYEPEPSNFNLLVNNLRINGIKNVEPFQVAVYDKKGVLPFFICGTRNTGGHSFSKALLERDKVPSTITINVKTLLFSDIVRSLGEVGFVKMDCEAAEYPILFSTPDDVLKKIEKIVIEYHDPSLLEKLKGKLEKSFDVKVCKENDLIFAWRR